MKRELSKMTALRSGRLFRLLQATYSEGGSAPRHSGNVATKMRTFGVFIAITALLHAACHENATPGSRPLGPALQTPRKSAHLSQIAAIRAGDGKAVKRSSSSAVSTPRSLLKTVLAILQRMPFIGFLFRQQTEPTSSRLMQKSVKRTSGLYRIQQVKQHVTWRIVFLLSR